MAVSFAWLRNFFSAGVGNREKGQQLTGGESRANESNVPLSDHRALEVPTVFSCIRLLSEIVGSLPLGVYERVAGGRKSAESHPVAELLETPNELMTRQQLIEALVAQIAGWGNGYDLIDRNDAGKPVALWPMLPPEMTVHRDGFESLRYRYRTSTGQREFTPDKILHVRGFGTDGIVGLSVLGYARQALGLSIAAEKYAASFYASGGRPSGVLQVEKPLTPDQRKALKENYGPMIGGSGGENGLWVLEAFAKYQAISISPEDAQMLLTRQFSVEEIARFFRVPLSLLMHGSKDSNWGTGLEQQNLAFLTYTLRPYLTRIEQTINRQLFTPAERKKFYVEFAVEGLLRGDSTARGNLYSTALQNGWMSRNEVRALENLPPYEGGDKFTAQTALTEVDKLGAEPPTPPPGAEPPAKSAAVEFNIDASSAPAGFMKAVGELSRDLAENTASLKAAAGEATKTRIETAATLRDGLAQITREVGKPRKAIIDRHGNPIGSVVVDKLEP